MWFMAFKWKWFLLSSVSDHKGARAQSECVHQDLQQPVNDHYDKLMVLDVQIFF